LARLRTNTAQPQPVEAEPRGPLLPIELYTTDGQMLGWIGPLHERTSDRLNSTEPLRIAELHAADGASSTDRDILDEDNGLRWSEQPREDVYFVVPPPLLSPNRHLRLHRRLEEISLDVGPYTVNGLVHIRPGSQVSDFILHSGRRFLPMTRVEVRQDGDPTWWRSASVVIINTAFLTWLSGSR
jgi:hypothetical protein